MGSIDEEPGGINMPLGVWVAGRAAVWLGDPAKVRAAIDRVAGLDASWIVAARRSFEAAIAAMEGHPKEAAASYEAVLATRLAVGDRFAHAQMVVDATAVLPPDLVPEGAVETARAFLAEIGAAPLLARLEAATVPASAPG
jgi:hypothetical protein